jgi:transposase-like protein
VGRTTWDQAGAEGRLAGLHAVGDIDHAAEIARLQRENERLRMERDILKKSIAIFAGVQK